MYTNMSDNILRDTSIRMSAEQYRQLVDNQIAAQDYVNILKKIEYSEYADLSILERQRLAMRMTIEAAKEKVEKERQAISIVRDA